MRRLLFICLSLLIVTGCQSSVSTGSFTFSEKDLGMIENYLETKVFDPNFGGEIFTAYEVLESNKDAGEVYLWALIQEYYKVGERLEKGTGISVPMVLTVREDVGSLEVIDHSLPRDGSYYPEDIKDMFPKKIQGKIFDYSSKHIQELITEIEKKANE